MDYDDISKRIRDGHYNINPHQFDDDIRNFIKEMIPTDSDAIAARVFNEAWEEGHSAGYNEVLIYANNFGSFIHDIDILRKREER